MISSFACSKETLARTAAAVAHEGSFGFGSEDWPILGMINGGSHALGTDGAAT